MLSMLVVAAVLLGSIFLICLATVLSVRMVEHSRIVRTQEEEQTKRQAINNAWQAAEVERLQLEEAKQDRAFHKNLTQPEAEPVQWPPPPPPKHYEGNYIDTRGADS